MQAGAERLLGRLALTAGETTDAERYVHDALGRLGVKGFALDIPECLDVLAAAAATQESFKEAARLLGAAAAARARLGIVRFPPEPEFWSSVEGTTREALGPEGYDAAFTAGAALGTDEAAAYVRRARGQRKRTSRGWDSLTRPSSAWCATSLAASPIARSVSACSSPWAPSRPISRTSSPSWAHRHVPTWPRRPPDADSTAPRPTGNSSAQDWVAAFPSSPRAPARVRAGSTSRSG